MVWSLLFRRRRRFGLLLNGGLVRIYWDAARRGSSARILSMTLPGQATARDSCGRRRYRAAGSALGSMTRGVKRNVSVQYRGRDGRIYGPSLLAYSAFGVYRCFYINAHLFDGRRTALEGGE